MKIGIIGGTGKEGSGLALRWAAAGHDVVIGSRTAERGEQRAAELSESIDGTIHGGDNDAAVSHGEVVVLSVPFSGHHATVSQYAEALAGKTLVDITVPLVPPKVSRVQLPECTSAALQSKSLVGENVAVAAAFHHVSSVHLANLGADLHTDVLVVGDSKATRQTILDLISDMGARGIDAGALENSIALESLTPVLIHINKTYKIPGAGIHITGLED